MNLPDRMHCPGCKGRLAPIGDTGFTCAACERAVPAPDGIPDFLAGVAAPHQEAGPQFRNHPDGAELIHRLRAAAGHRWPSAAGDTVLLGCAGPDAILALASGETLRTLLVIDPDHERLWATKTHLSAQPAVTDGRVAFARARETLDDIRDAVADTLICTTAAAGIADTRGFLTTIHRILKPGGRAAIVVPNRRFAQALASAFSSVLAQRFARDGVWPPYTLDTLEVVARVRRLCVHARHPAYQALLAEKRLFDADTLADMGLEVGFATSETMPLFPDPSGAEAAARFVPATEENQAGILAPLVATTGRPYFDLLDYRDSSLLTLLWLTKPRGPETRIFNYRPEPRPIPATSAEGMLGGAQPRWSVELVAEDTPDGIRVKLGGWCLANTELAWLRMTVDGTAQTAPIWRPRPDVHEVLNRAHLYHPIHAFCAGLDADLLYPGVHDREGGCPLKLEIILASGLIIAGPAPATLVLNEQVVIGH